MTIQFQPLGSRILVEIEPESAKSDVIAVVSQYASTARVGSVLAVGPEVTRVSVGDRVWLSTLAGAEVGVGSGETLVLPETSVVAIVLEPA